jgi:hypothetical protein
MSDTGNFTDGRGLLTTSPFRSGQFIVTTLVAMGSILVDAYIVYRHWRTAGVYAALILSILIGVQLIYQWLRALRYYAKLRDLYSGPDEGIRAGSPLGVALRIAAGGMINLLFFSFGTILLALILIGVLLTRLDGMR